MLEPHQCVHQSTFWGGGGWGGEAFYLFVPAKKGLSVRLVYVVVCAYVCIILYLSFRARSGVAGLVSASQCMSRGHESIWDTSLIFYI